VIDETELIYELLEVFQSIRDDIRRIADAVDKAADEASD
jgi:hypothetical protein